MCAQQEAALIVDSQPGCDDTALIDDCNEAGRWKWW